ncbi:MAG TPA: LysM peptidoglycan-binding domain-containing protein [Rectinemataceae bacterium]
MKKTSFVLCSLLFLGAAFLNAAPVTHILQKGETLYSISRLFKVPYEALAAANGISDPTKLKIGTVLIIPSVHKVEKGDTLYGISRRYGVSLAELLEANKISQSYVLKVGEFLVVPGALGEGASNSPASGAAQGPSPSAIPDPAQGSKPQSPPSVAPPTATATPAAPPAVSTSVSPAAKPASSIPVTVSSSTTIPPQPPPVAKSPSVPMPEPLKTQEKQVDAGLKWPAAGKAMYLDGKLEGIMIRVKPGETAKAIASGTVVSAGPSRGFSNVVFIQARSGYVFVYGGNEVLSVKTGDKVVSGSEIGKIGIDPKDGTPIAYFFVFRNGQPVDPATAPRD